MVTTGPGGTNAMTGVAAAYIESTPMLIISGQVKLADQIRDQGVRQQGMQEVDIVSIAKPVTKYAAMVEKPEDIRYHLERALFEATTGRKGPVWVDIPLDIQASVIDAENLRGYATEVSNEADSDDGRRSSEDIICSLGKNYQKPAASQEQIARVIEAMQQAKRPALLLGNGIRLADAFDELEAFLKLYQVPVLTTWNGIDLIAEDHPLFFGRPGGMGQRYANLVQQNADFLLSIGARQNLLQTGYQFDGFARGAFKVMVDIDEAELHKINVRPDLAICADAGEFLRSLLEHREEIETCHDISEWIAYANRAKKAFPIVTDDHWAEKEFVNTYALLDTITEQMKPDDIYVSGSSGTCIDISMQTFRVKKGQRVFATKGLASMGFGLPATIGACLASGKKRTVCVNGDGGFMMNIQELETLHRLQLPVKIFVLCNHGYGQIHTTQKNVFAGHYVACDEGSQLSLPDIAKVAAAFGLQTVQIHTNTELKSKVDEVLQVDGPVICQVYTSIDLGALPKQVSYKRKDGQMESLPLEYMNPMLSDEEMDKWMLIPAFERQ